MRGAGEDGDPSEVRVVPEGSPVATPAFDVTRAELVTGLVTESGVVPATPEALAEAYWRALQVGEPELLPEEEMAEVRERFSEYGGG